ncbi:hypothetical protein TSUD_364200 [Trifolium subterraneum]|uniref:SHSP domain-containing protein n=1 Tax=Trifolium subterraneum TaxID=3900 RepID=A0A2Z6LYZ3_TRISU|nr:hypothetical protein TSUD_364200 [Trifolium subterraneum]
MLRITGERPIQGNKWRKFDQTYPVPQNSEAEKLEAKFEQGTLILKMQKKLIPQSQVAPKQEVEKTQEKSSQDPSNNKANFDETNVEKVQETIPPTQSTKLEESTKDMKSDSPQTQSLEKKIENDDDTSSQIPKEAISNNTTQKGQQELEPKPTSKDTIKDQIDEKAQKGQEEFEQKTTSIEQTKTQIDEKAQKGQEEFEPNTTSIEKTNSQANANTQKGQEEVEPKPIERMVTKEKLEEKIVTKSDKDVENEVKEKNEKPYESSKTMKDVKNQNLQENEIEKAEPSASDVSQKEMESCCRISPNQEGNMNGIRKLVAASSQFVTRIAEGKWSGEERHLVENVGAAVLVIAAFGAYVSYRFSS